MIKNLISIVIVFLWSVQCAFAHMYVVKAAVGGDTTDCLRVRDTKGNTITNAPIKDLTSSDMTCGFGPVKPAPKQCSVKAGDDIEVKYGMSDSGDQIMPPDHHGPCNVYIVESKDEFKTAPTKGWLKLYTGTVSTFSILFFYILT
jgi:Cu/Ag efflux protein CusF